MRENKKTGLNITIKEGVSFWIGDAEVRINAARKGYARLSVIAPKDIIVNRRDPASHSVGRVDQGLDRLATHESPEEVAGSNPASTPEREKGQGSPTDGAVPPTKNHSDLNESVGIVGFAQSTPISGRTPFDHGST